MRAHVEEFAAACGRAMAEVGTVEHDLVLGGAAVRLRFAGESLVPLIHGLRHQLRAPAKRAPAATIELWDAASTGVLPPPLPVAQSGVPAEAEILTYGGMTVLVQSPVRGRDGAYEALTVLDAETATARCFVTTPARIPRYEYAAPLRPVLQWALNGRDHVFVHAGAVGAGGRGVLLTGRAGSGKSTTAVAGLIGGLDYLGDDYVFVDLADARPVAHSVYATAKLAPGAPAIAGLDAEPLAGGAAKHVVDVETVRAGGLARRMEIVANLLPVVAAGEPTRIEPATAGAALLALAPTSVLHPPQRDAGELAPLATLARRVPAHRLVLGGEPRDAVTLIRRLLEDA
jgi:hypothetical protein